MNFITSSKWKFFLFTFLFVLNTSLITTAAEITQVDSSCGDMSFQVMGKTYIKPDQEASYTISSNSILDQQANVEYELRYDNKLIEVETWHQFTYLFVDHWTYLLKTFLRRSELCSTSLEQEIVVAKEIWLGIWLKENDASFLTQAITNQWIWFLFNTGLSDTLNEEATLKRIQQIAQILPSSDVLFVHESQARLLFDHLDDMRIYGIWFPERIILVGNIGTSALRRLLHQSPSITNFSEIAITPTAYLSSVIQQLVNWQSLQQLTVVRLLHPNDNSTARWLPLSKATDYLLTHGVSITFLLFLLCIPLVVLCLVILKQVVWFQIGGIYYILLVAAANIFVGFQVSLLMFLAAFLGHLVAQLITKRIYLLFAPKVWLSITLTCISFIWLSILASESSYSVILPTDPMYVFFPLMTFSLMMQYIYPNYNSIFKRDWWVWFIQFMMWIAAISYLLERTRLHQFILWYPDSILLVIVAIIYLWRFAWLQVSEYLRFWPLIAKYFDTEE